MINASGTQMNLIKVHVVKQFFFLNTYFVYLYLFCFSTQQNLQTGKKLLR